MTTTNENIDALNIAATDRGEINRIAALSAENFRLLLYRAPEKLLWVPSVRLWLEDRPADVIHALQFVAPGTCNITEEREIECLIIRADAHRLLGDLHDAEKDWRTAFALNEAMKDESDDSYLSYNVAMMRAKLHAANGNYWTAANTCYKLATRTNRLLCSPHSNGQITSMRRLGTVFMLYEHIKNRLQNVANLRLMLKEASMAMVGTYPNDETVYGVWTVLLSADWLLGDKDEDSEWLPTIQDAMKRDQYLCRMFKNDCIVLHAARMARDPNASEHERTAAFVEAKWLSEGLSRPIVYRAEALLACAQIQEARGEYGDAVEIAWRLVRMKKYHGPAKTIAEDLIDRVVHNHDP